MNANEIQLLTAAIESLKTRAADIQAEAMAIVASNEANGEIRYANGAQAMLHEKIELRSTAKALEAILANA